MLQSIMLRGYGIDYTLFYALLAIGLTFFIIAFLMLHRRLQMEWS
jgi:hypothetical protein